MPLALAALAMAAVAVLGASLAPAAEIRPGTLGLDYRNRPEVVRLRGFEYVALSPRATGAAHRLHAAGTKILYWIQPFVCLWRGEPPREPDFQGQVHALARRHHAFLADTAGAAAAIRSSDVESCLVLDFRDPEFARALAELVARRFRGGSGLLLDYGCPALEWEVSLGAVDPAVWPEWAEGYRLFRETLTELRPEWLVLCQCDRWAAWLPQVCDGLLLEKVGWTLNPFEKVWETLTSREARSAVLYFEDPERRDPRARRLAAAVALATGSLFSYREPGSGPPLRDPEHFELDLGVFEEPYREIAPEVFERRSSHGVVVVNLSGRPFRYRDREIPARDALVAQTRHTETGRPIPWRTTLPPANR